MSSINKSMKLLNKRNELLFKIIGNRHAILVRSNSKCSGQSQYQEVSIPVPWGEVRGKWWGPMNVRPILTTHGWQDSCGSFDRLMPLLDQNYSFLAIDWPGHGLSSRLPQGMYYFFHNYLLTTLHVIKYFKWEKTSFLGHSLGGLVSLVYAMYYPNSVDFVVCCDSTTTIDGTLEFRKLAPEMLEQFLKFSKQAEDSTTEPPSYSLDEIKKKVINALLDNSVKYQYAHHILDRNIAPSKIHPGRYYFSRDPRVKSDCILPFHIEDLLGYTKDITSPVLMIKGTQTIYEVSAIFVDALRKQLKDFRFVEVEGTHHVHLNSPENVAEVINEFIREYDGGKDRSKGGSEENSSVIIRGSEGCQ